MEVINICLTYDFTFRKGILFVRLKGNANQETRRLLTEEIKPLILDNGIKKVVFNVEKVSGIDNSGVLALYDCYLALNKESEVTLCSIPSYLREKFQFLLKYIKEREDEYTILKRKTALL